MDISSDDSKNEFIRFALNKGVSSTRRCNPDIPTPDCPASPAGFRLLNSGSLFCSEVPVCFDSDCFSEAQDCESSLLQPFYYCVILVVDESTTFEFQNPGFFYTITGYAGNNPAITVERGRTYNFDFQAANSGHPIALRLAGGSTAAVPGTTGNSPSNGVHGPGAIVTYMVPMDSPDALVYQCVVHTGMIGTINVVDAADCPPDMISCPGHEQQVPRDPDNDCGCPPPVDYSSVIRIPFESYNPLAHTLVGGLRTESESCPVVSGGSSSSSSSSSHGESHCPAIECGCEPSESNPCYHMDCGVIPGEENRWVVDCDLCECVEVVVSSSSSSGVSSSSSSGVSSSSSSGVSSSSSSGPPTGDGGGDGGTDCSSGMDRSIVGVQGLNEEMDPAHYYGEDGFGEWSVGSAVPMEIRYSSLPFRGLLPDGSNIFWDGVVVASITYPPNYVGETFAVVIDGEVRCGVVTAADIML